MNGSARTYVSFIDSLINNVVAETRSVEGRKANQNNPGLASGSKRGLSPQRRLELTAPKDSRSTPPSPVLSEGACETSPSSFPNQSIEQIVIIIYEGSSSSTSRNCICSPSLDLRRLLHHPPGLTLGCQPNHQLNATRSLGTSSISHTLPLHARCPLEAGPQPSDIHQAPFSIAFALEGVCWYSARPSTSSFATAFLLPVT